MAVLCQWKGLILMPVPGKILLSSVSINQKTFSSSWTTSNIRPAMKFKPYSSIHIHLPLSTGEISGEDHTQKLPKYPEIFWSQNDGISESFRPLPLSQVVGNPPVTTAWCNPSTGFNEWINNSNHQSINQSINKSHLVGQSVSQLVSQSVSQPLDRVATK